MELVNCDQVLWACTQLWLLAGRLAYAALAVKRVNPRRTPRNIFKIIGHRGVKVIRIGLRKRVLAKPSLLRGCNCDDIAGEMAKPWQRLICAGRLLCAALRFRTRFSPSPKPVRWPSCVLLTAPEPVSGEGTRVRKRVSLRTCLAL